MKRNYIKLLRLKINGKVVSVFRQSEQQLNKNNKTSCEVKVTVNLSFEFEKSNKKWRITNSKCSWQLV